MFFGSCPSLPSLVSSGLLHLQRDRVRVEAADAVDAALGWQRDHVRRVEGPQPEQVEDDPRSTKNGSSRWPANTLEPSGSVWTAAAASAVVVRASSAGRSFTGGVGRSAAEHRAARRAVVARHRVDLADVKFGIVERRDRAGVVEERVRVLDLGPEPELVDDVVDGVAVVVDVDLVEDVVAELVEVRAAGRAPRAG